MEGHSLARASRVHEDTINIKGWSFRARTAPIISSALLDQYSEQLGGVLTLPEITFGNSSLQIRHEASGVVLFFSALDALKQWRKDNLPSLKVNLAKEWQAARMHEIQKQQAVVLEYDWTYTTSYQGSISWCPPLFGPTEQQKQQAASIIQYQQQPQQVAAGQATVSTAVQAAVSTATAAAVSAATAAAADGQVIEPLSAATDGLSLGGSTSSSSSSSDRPLPQWQASTTQIDRSMLMSKDEPILFYAEVPLYESELDDNGVCQLTVKVRVMPRCWLVLMRFWLRVDGTLVRLREVRHFCRLDTPEAVVIRETKHCEGTMQELAAAGAPTAVSGYEDADATAAVFSAIAPQCLKKFELHELQLPCSSSSGERGML